MCVTGWKCMAGWGGRALRKLLRARTGDALTRLGCTGVADRARASAKRFSTSSYNVPRRTSGSGSAGGACTIPPSVCAICAAATAAWTSSFLCLPWVLLTAVCQCPRDEEPTIMCVCTSLSRSAPVSTLRVWPATRTRVSHSEIWDYADHGSLSTQLAPV